MVKHYSVLQAYRLLMPYFFRPDEETKFVVEAYNRDYEKIPKARILFKRNPAGFKGVWFERGGGAPFFTSSGSGSRPTEPDYYMYNDDPATRKDYWDRLGKLYSHKHAVVDESVVSWRQVLDG